MDPNRPKSMEGDIVDVLLRIKENGTTSFELTFDHIKALKRCSVNGYEIGGGSTVYINAWAIARDPATWEHADEFLPESFLESDLDPRGQTPELIPFGFGRRGCPGIGMAMAEVELALANVVYKFDWGLPVGMKEEDIDFEVLPGITMHKKNDLRLLAKLVIA
ncbi:cytochrome P450 71A9-like [Salvia divinorum]